MVITQDELNTIIDLWVEVGILTIEFKHNPTSEAALKLKTEEYISVVSALYNRCELAIPTSLTTIPAPCGIGASERSTCSGTDFYSKSTVNYLIFLKDIFNILEGKFQLEEENSSTALVERDVIQTKQPLSQSYAGKYSSQIEWRLVTVPYEFTLIKSSDIDRIAIEGSPSTTKQSEPNEFPMHFLLRLMSHPVTPLMGAILLVAGIATATLSVALGVGIGGAVAGAVLLAGYAGARFFSASPRPKPNVSIEDDNQQEIDCCAHPHSA